VSGTKVLEKYLNPRRVDTECEDVANSWGLERQEKLTQFWFGNLLENVYLGDREGNGMTHSRYNRLEFRPVYRPSSSFS
jgi:hypothetical protein